jgi:nucleoid-associated protein YgaU
VTHPAGFCITEIICLNSWVAIEWADLFAQVKVTRIAPLIENGSTQKWASIVSIDILTKGVSAKTKATVLWSQAMADATLTRKAPPLTGHIYTAHLRKGDARADYEPVHPDWAFVDPMPDRTESEPAYLEHLVQDGDTLWGLAVKYYGRGQRWRVLRVANFTKDAEGEVYPLRPGMRIHVPTFPMKREEMKQDTQPTNAPYSDPAARSQKR